MRGFATPPIPSPTEIKPHTTGVHFLQHDPIPIDPALSGQPLDPVLVVGQSHIADPLIAVRVDPTQKLFLAHNIQYSQGPQGDPFALPEPPVLPPVEAPPLVQLKPSKKKRKTLPENICSVCRVEEKVGADGPEVILSCVDCKEVKGHPSCLNVSNPAEAVKSSSWQCFACKTCESCLKKDGDNRLLLCDSCDRGWHTDCLDPPLEEAPPGDWFCPRCAPPMQEIAQAVAFMQHDPLDFLASCAVASEPLREPSVASSSRSALNESSRSRRRGKSRTVVSDEEDGGMDVDPTPGPSRLSTRLKSRRSEKSPVGEKRPSEPTSSPLQSLSSRRPRIRLSSPKPPPPPLATIRLKLPARGKGKEREEDPDDSKGMFDEFLAPEDRDVGATNVGVNDKARFDSSRARAEEKIMPPPPPPPIAVASEEPGPSSRPLRSTHQNQSTPLPVATSGTSASPAPSTPAPPATQFTAGQRIRSIRFGEYDIQTWYDAPFPEEYMSLPDGKLWICEFCLKYMKSAFNASRHKLKCKMRHPPGDEIYRDGSIAVFEVDGRKNKIYCQNLCLLSKMFLDHKSLFYDVEPFLFYVITDIDDIGARFVGYFSKEKRCPKDYNLSCIMTLPIRQRQGWGMLLMDFSYLLSKKERRAGTPEKPLSALGALGYKSYWTLALMRYLRTAPDNPRLEDISRATSMTLEDVYRTVLQQNMIRIRENAASPRPLPGQSLRFVKGRKSGVARKALHRNNTRDDDSVKGPFVPPSSYEISWDREVVTRYLETWNSKGYLTLKPENLKWSPFLVARTLKSEGLLEDILPSVTESATPTTPGFGTRSSIAGDSRTESPAFALFDDDDDDVLPASDVLPVLRSRGRQVVQSPESSVVLPSSPNSDQTPRRLTRRQTSGNLSTVTPKQPSSLRRTRSAVKLPSVHHDEAMIAEDAAFAAKLAMEEERPRRLLRSRSNTEQEKRPLSPRASSSSASPRKRKRMRTSSPPARNTRSKASLPTPRRPPTRRRSSVRTPARRPRPQRRASRVVPEDVEESPQSRSSPPPTSPSPVPSSRSNEEDDEGEEEVDAEEEEEEEEAVEAEEEEEEEEEEAEAEAAEEEEEEEEIVQHESIEPEPEPERDKEMKDEERDTPLTGITSRHSVGHSDDTVYVTEDPAATALAHKVSPPLIVTPVVGPTEVVNAPMPSLSVPGGDSDLDAEGEDDVDAEGEDYVEEEDVDIDAEGEDDLDAEGEPDEEGDEEIVVDDPIAA